MTPPNIQALDTAEDQIQRDDILVENWQRAVRFGYALTAKVIVDAYVAGYSPSQICVVLGLCSYQVTRLLGYGLLVRKWQAIGLSEDIMPSAGLSQCCPRCRKSRVWGRSQQGQHDARAHG